jgi:hypothetical protein
MFITVAISLRMKANMELNAGGLTSKLAVIPLDIDCLLGSRDAEKDLKARMIMPLASSNAK